MKRLTLLFLVAACSVPQLKDLGDKRCDLDGGHACVDGYTCQSGLCKIPTGMPCTEGQTKACGTDVGECVRGTQRCIDGVFGACEGEVGPASEVCDGKDNDCDSMTDEDLATAPSCELQEGVCAGKKKACVGGSYAATCGATEYGTDYEATESRCDGQDNDCDGMTDEGVGGGACPAMGICSGFQRACTAGQPGVCLAPGFEMTETSCDNQDNDCDGLVDEGIVSSTPCALTQGVCSGKNKACRNGAIETTCSSASYGPNYELTEVTCDGLDNDCNGVVDRLVDGGYVRVGGCELNAGVCSGASRACIAGNGEAPCTAASYGAQYEVSEFSCDGLDNDCDGRTDVSKELSLVATANAPSNHISLAAASVGGTGAVYVDQRRSASRVFFRRFDAQLQPATNEVELSDPQATDAIRPSLTRLGADFAAVWLETVGGSTRIVLARIGNTGTVAWSFPVASNVSVFKDPKVAGSATSDASVAVAWIGSDLVLRGASYDGTMAVLAAPKNLVAAPDAGGDLVFGVDVVRRTSTGDFLVGWVAQSNGFKVRFQAFNTGLVAQGTVREEAVSGETADSIRVAVSGASGEVLGAWLGSTGSVTSLRWLPNALSSPSNQVASTYGGLATDLAVAATGSGAIAFWAQGGATARLVGLALGGDAGVRDFTPSGVTGLFAPGVAFLDGGLVQVGYEADRGTGLDLFGQVICQP